jgi:hypothetical protein
MAIAADALPATQTPLERFLRDYLEAVQGAWDEVEPQVYDVLIPPGPGSDSPLDGTVLRVAFDPEALPEHPGAQLAAFGSPLIDRLLAQAQRRGQHARFYRVGLERVPHDLVARMRRGISLPPQLHAEIERVRTLDFPQAIFWFQATFISDHNEQEIVPAAVDLHYCRQMRHTDELLDPARLANTPGVMLPEVRRASVHQGYRVARERVIRTVAALANTRARGLAERLDRQVGRMMRYYADLRSELGQRAGRGAASDEADRAARRQALEREERLRVAELRQKSALRVELRLLNLVQVHQPKLLVRTRLVSADRPVAAAVELVWDPLTEAWEATNCPVCGRPTLEFDLSRVGLPCCPSCAAAPAAPRAKRPK